MSDIFLSYASEDRERVQPLVRILEQRGWSVFWDRTIPAGATWRHVISDELRSAGCVIVVWTGESIQSTWVAEEADSGRERGILIPILFDDVQPPLGFRAIQARDLTEWEADRTSTLALDAFLDNIEGFLGSGDGGDREFTAGPGPAVSWWRRPVARLAALALVLLIVGIAALTPESITDDVIPPLPAGVTRLEQDLEAAENGVVESMALLGDRYRVGRGVEQNYAEALRWYRKAAEAGSSRGMLLLGLLHLEGKGVTKDPEEAARRFREAADAGHAIGMDHLASMYSSGDGVAQDAAEAARLYLAMAERGDPVGMGWLGRCYYLGQGVPEDLGKAVAWLRKGADAGDAFSMASLGYLHRSGRGLKQDDVESLRWYRLAADRGHTWTIEFLKEEGELAQHLAADIPDESDISGRWKSPEGWIFQFQVRKDRVFGELRGAPSESGASSGRYLYGGTVMDGKLTKDTVTFHTLDFWEIPQYSTDAQGNRVTTYVRKTEKVHYHGAVSLNEIRFQLTHTDGRKLAPVTVKRVCARGPESPRFGIVLDRYAPNAVVKSVHPDSPAESSGLRVGDIITSIDEQAIGSGREVGNARVERRIGDTVQLEVFREGEAGLRTIEVVLGPPGIRR
jgi:hypothetical protein